MVIFLDTSAWVKYFIQEKGTQELQDFLIDNTHSDSHIVTVSAVPYAEMHATLKRALKGNRLAQADYAQAISEFENQWNSVDVPQVDEQLIKTSGDFAKRYALKGCDAFQLASAIKAHAALLINADEELRQAAESQSIRVWNPADGHFSKTMP